MNIQKRYWMFLKDVKGGLFLLEQFMYHDDKVNNYITYFMAIASSTSIGGWIVKSDYAFLWSVIIVFSQIINAIKPYLPYSKRIQTLKQMFYVLSQFCFEIEKNWFFVSNGELSEKEINEKLYKFQLKREKINNAYLYNLVLPINQKFTKNAQIILDDYLKVNYGEEINERY